MKVAWARIGDVAALEVSLTLVLVPDDKHARTDSAQRKGSSFTPLCLVIAGAGIKARKRT